MEKTVVPCIKCSQKLRIPSDKEMLDITCPVCHAKWRWKNPAFKDIEQPKTSSAAGDIETPSTSDKPVNSSKNAHNGEMPLGEKSKSKEVKISDILAILFLIVIALSSVGHLLVFVKEFGENGLAQAQKQQPVGGLFFGLVLVVLYILAIPFLRKNGFGGVANVMSILLLLVVFVVIGKVAGCSSSDSSYQDCEAGRYGYTCR